ncbi:hypothetical protein AB0F20_17240 [Streptomyces goshikiensis]|uniref:hypothetical protein n=1 Tax=Streptomyces goshikiensis TaxID=1942 RepID=UPI0033FC238D
MAHSDPGPGPTAPADFEFLKEEWSRRRAKASEELHYFDTLLQSAQDIEEIKDLWNQLAAGPIRHPLFSAARQETEATASPSHAAIELSIEQILLLMQQQPPRLWPAKDVAVALSHPSLAEVRDFLKVMAQSGHLEEVRRKGRHILFRVPVASATVD